MTPNRYIVQAYELPDIWYSTEVQAMDAGRVLADETGRNVFVWERWPDGWLGKLAEYEPSGLVPIDPETNAELRQVMDAAPPSPRLAQPDMFAGRTDDLPLFSGTAPRAQVQPFDPPDASHQPTLPGFDFRPTMGQVK